MATVDVPHRSNLSPARFGGADHFQSEVAQLTEYVKSCPRIEGVNEIILPGDPERRLAAVRMREGIFLDDENWNALLKLGKQLGVAAPSP